MKLLCKTSDDTGDFQWATIDLTVESAGHLLRGRELVRAALAYDVTFYGIEFFMSSAAYFDGVPVGDWNPDKDQGPEELLSSPAFFLVPDNFDAELEPGRIAADTVRIMKSGVLWSASAKHSDDDFETPEMAWADLESVAQGRCPFPELPKEARSDGEGQSPRDD